jgi:hypothetical protein
MQVDRLSGHFSTPPMFKPRRAVQENYNRIVAIVKGEPGLTRHQIADRYYPASASGTTRQGINDMLIQLNLANRIQYLDGDRYVVVENQNH